MRAMDFNNLTSSKNILRQDKVLKLEKAKKLNLTEFKL
jgi:hypothetical protein